ncbi:MULTISPECIES: PA14 domain-containing protein [Nostoc]|uniref:PQQ-dependent sugar dehydrogenase n=1 Tax=Nostoc paludosum FACHB-159 TaxID=2692908 RepID=A0ABR8KC16_9NOSO|nr:MULTISPECIES: PA14 domain-containing protein [Nostoc]MBD2682246.1 PQQ-dependent sugar dehydrogenase [Nostoc sp. FACHB-857]MBD2736585.1 PQQ-dependent sugar dehydrogenase [Nostoc paludosum FACHB-159]
MDNLQNQNNPLSSTSTSTPISGQSSLAALDQAQPSLLGGSSNLISQGNGLKAEYFDNADFTNLKLTRTDSTVNFLWGNGSPDALIGADTFSVRWTGQVEAKYSETYNFYTRSDDGVRLWVNNQLVIDKFVNQSPTEYTGSLALVAGQKYDIKLEYFDNTYSALSQLSWSSNSQAKEIIPQSQLYTPVSTPVGNGNGLKAEYFDNADFTNLKLTRTDSTVNFLWGSGSPDPLIGADTFSARWTGQVQAKYSETYNFYTRSDDGVRLWVNNQLLIDKFVNQSATEYSGSIALVAGQKYDIKLEYFDNAYSAVSQLSWSSNSQAKEIIPQSQLYSQVSAPVNNGNGLKGEYFDNADFTNLKLTRTDGTVNFLWGSGSPDPLIGADTFSVRWTGQVQAKYSETYNFYTRSDDGVRLWVNNQLLIDKFVNQSATEYSGSIALVAGQKYDIKLEYFDNAYSAVSQLSWSSNSQAKEIIPQSQLYSSVLPTTITLSTSPTSVNEGDGNVTVSVLRSGDLSGTSSIQYATLSNTATAGDDYANGGEEIGGTLTFAPGESSKQIVIPIFDDLLAESDENFSVAIDQPEGATLGIQRTLGITIKDNDSQGLNFTQPVVNENAGTATVTVTRNNASAAASVNYTTADGAAKAGSDYVAVAGTLNFAVGETSKNISITLKDDSVTEADEAFILKFSNAVGVLLPITQTTVTIADNDLGDFQRKTVVSGLTTPIDFGWSANDDLMFIAQKDGVVKVFNTGTGVLESKPFIDISSQVNNVSDRGLLSLAVHPDFGKTPNGKNYVYLLFTYDPVETNKNDPKNNPNSTLDDPDKRGNRAARLIRVTADPNTGYKTAIAGSAVILVGKNSVWDYISRPDKDSTFVDPNDETKNEAPSGILNKTTGKLFANADEYVKALKTGNILNVQDFAATDSATHSGGSVRFGNDGTLFVSFGDGTSYNRADIRAARVQDIDNLSGKILHIDAITGQGLASNPFYNGDPNSNRSKVYDLGLRNPFRFTVNQNTNVPFIGDVGWYKWEEVNVGGPGKNFGWPFYEGGVGPDGKLINIKQNAYSNLDIAKEFYDSTSVTAPIYAYDHLTGSTSVGVGTFYSGGSFNNALMIFNPSKGSITALTLDNQNKVIGTTQFASDLGAPVSVQAGDDGKLYYADLISGKIDSWTPV